LWCTLPGRFSIPIRAPAAHSSSSWEDTLAAPSWSHTPRI
jgi:hypothetical protein